MSTEYNSSTDFLQQAYTSAIGVAEFYGDNLLNLTQGSEQSRPTLREPKISHQVSAPNLGPAPKLSDVLGADDGGSELLQLLDSEADKWIDKYFPAAKGGFSQLPEQFLLGVISGLKPFGLDKSVFDIAWQRARDRGYKTAETERAQIRSLFSANGFETPPGYQIAAEKAAYERASDAAAEVNRQQAVQDATIRFEMMRFAVEQEIGYQRGIIAALADYQRQVAVLPNSALERARIRAQAQATLTSALSSYWDVNRSYEELKLKVATASADVDLNVSGNRIRNAQADATSNKAASVATAVEAFADAASNAAQAAGTLVARVESV